MPNLDSLLPKAGHENHLEARKLAKRGLRIGRTRVGKGVFATKRLIDGSCIGEIQGEILSADAPASRYSFNFHDGTLLEPTYPFRFVNHSCDPNCAYEIFRFDQAPRPQAGNSFSRMIDGVDRRLLLFAICDIASGEELTIDYSWPKDFAMRCNCRARDCRGWIVDPEFLPHFTGAAGSSL